MKYNSTITGIALLEAVWTEKHMDLLDLISPFVVFSVAKTTKIDRIINIDHVVEYVQKEFGFTDIPNSVIEKIIRRENKRFQKIDKQYYLKSDLSEHVEHFEQRRTDCLSKIDSVKGPLFSFLESHCRRSKIKNEEHAIELLQRFFSKFCIQTGLHSLEEEVFSSKEDEVNYYIAQFIYEEKKKKSKVYRSIIDLTKGYLLQSAVYMQNDNFDINSARYKDIKIVCDTMFLINLLGYKGDVLRKSALYLCTMLQKQGARLYYFKTAEEEILSILTAYQYSFSANKKISRTLEGLDEKGYQPESVIRLKNSFVDTLSKKYNIELLEIPPYKTKADGSINIDALDLSEMEAKEFVSAKTLHYSEENLNADISSASAIHRIRDGYVSNRIEKCKAIFLTTNPIFTKVFNEFYKKRIKDGIPPVITDFDLSAITWVKSGTYDSDIPETQLLSNAYSASQPNPLIFEQCERVLKQLEFENRLSDEEALLLRSDRVTQRELWIERFPSADEIDEDYILSLKKKQQDKIRKDALSEEEKRNKEREHAHKVKKNELAREFAKKKKSEFEKIAKDICHLVEIGLVAVALIGGWYSLSFDNVSWIISICVGAFCLLGIISAIDLIIGKRRIVNRIIEKCANQIETKKFEEKMKEYEQL